MTMTGPRILVVDDERAIRRFLAASLTAHGYIVREAGSGEEALTEVMAQRPDVIILDLWLPGIDGVEVTRRLREWTQTPIIVLSVRDDEQTKVTALDAGADDYLTKPFASEELLARVRAMTRRQGKVVLNELFFGDLTLTLDSAALACGKRSIHLSFKEFEVLKILMSNPRQIVPKESLIVKVWGAQSEAVDNNLEAYISFLRKKLFYLGSRVQITSQRRLGYQLEVEGE